MKGAAGCSSTPGPANCNRPGELALDFPQDEYSLMFPPSPERSPSRSSCGSSSGAVSPTPSAKSSSSASAGDSSPDTKTKRWVRKEKIGQGAQGSIYRCEETKTGREVAVKVIWTRELPPPAVEAVKREVKTMKRLRHIHLVRYLQATEKKQSELRIYMEYAAGGSLSSCLSRGHLIHQHFSTFEETLQGPLTQHPQQNFDYLELLGKRVKAAGTDEKAKRTVNHQPGLKLAIHKLSSSKHLDANRAGIAFTRDVRWFSTIATAARPEDRKRARNPLDFTHPATTHRHGAHGGNKLGGHRRHLPRHHPAPTTQRPTRQNSVQFCVYLSP
ncbi:hypothetical protein PR002_g6520 [Phytophthora rubi]|uniref:Protein kinase domain-containing protein n=1 Tax=Phytophthora rubi TaxID=129364 RepID=A0A6A3N249_9STRA|nr:hypothetical protein PR002_g6520 [Phytophthora rubi]